MLQIVRMHVHAWLQDMLSAGLRCITALRKGRITWAICVSAVRL